MTIMNSESFTSLLRALGLVQGSYKPAPNVALMGNGTIASIAFSTFFGAPNNTITSLDPGSLYNADRNTTIFDFLPTFRPNALDDDASAGSQCSVLPYNPTLIVDPTFPPFDFSMANVYRYRRQQSVNFGSWFVQENWMVPSLFTCASGPQAAEIDVTSGWGSTDNARAVLEHHWDTFINQTDFEYLASIGINTVRLPIGYWSLGSLFLEGTPFEPYASVYKNSWPRIVRAINTAAQSGIGVLVDLHGAVGSQNGQSHSGISDGQTRMFNNPVYMNKTLGVLTFLAQELQNATNVVGIQILNEPENVPELADFYSQAIEIIRQKTSSGSNFPLYIHDAFDLERFSDFIANRTDFIVEDHHSYFVFTPQDDSEPAAQHTGDVEGPIAAELSEAALKNRGNLVIDEWSCALTDKSLSTQRNPKEARKEFCTGQMNVYANTSAGWGFWWLGGINAAYYKEGCETDAGWCFKSAIGQSLPTTFFSYGKPPPTDQAQLQHIYTAVASMTVPPDPDVLHKLDNSTQSQTRPDQGNRKRDDDSSSRNLTSTQEQSFIKGYSDGFLTAKIFAQQGWSKLGFKGQYIEDSLRVLGTLIALGSEDYYRNGFKVGLGDGETFIMDVLA
ncbi:glycoside hydrolase family 5 protein [Hydnomerulius pinastri MD-312]|uniref:Glycoside hydrolase family 5 protein n=1 Tax=Hydnomerulius pinastri MD-312 TaxID=994086 RepID=A0A0C9W8Y3_9AGAM|nr:glycoside hydrolase family 5 protein [Hydnomerulius pinastri MD-312]